MILTENWACKTFPCFDMVNCTFNKTHNALSNAITFKCTKPRFHYIYFSIKFYCHYKYLLYNIRNQRNHPLISEIRIQNFYNENYPNNYRSYILIYAKTNNHLRSEIILFMKSNLSYIHTS